MLNRFKGVSFLSDIHLSEKGSEVLLLIDNQPARAYISTLSFFFTISISDSSILSDISIRYLTLLLAAHPEVHDYALQLSAAEAWLGCFYDKTLANETLATELEKQLALARYLTNVVAGLGITRQDVRHEMEL